MKLPEPAVLEKVRRWLSYADEDLRVARYDLSMPEAPPWRVIAFHAQQSAEKYLKAYLVFHLIDFPYTHDLRRLLDLCAAHAGWAEQLRDAEELTLYAITARYPWRGYRGERSGRTPSR
jgi:HEPN domain-containing protein